MTTAPSVTISLAEYEELLESDAMLNALTAAGVDNWDGYDEAISIYDEYNNSADEPKTIN